MSRFFLTIIVVLYLVFPLRSIAADLPDSLTPVQYLNLAYSLYNQSRFMESIQACEKSLQIKPDNADAYNGICAAFNSLQMWDEAINAGEKSLEIMPGSLQAYANITYSYTKAGRWEKAENACKEAIRLSPDNSIFRENLAVIKAGKRGETISHAFILMFAILLILFLVFSVYYSSSRLDLLTSSGPGIAEILLLSSSVSCLLYFAFFHFAPQFRLMNLKIPAEEFCYNIRLASIEHDGIEGYVLYATMFADLIGTFVLSCFASKIKNKTPYLLLMFSAALASYVYFEKIGFFPPMEAISAGLEKILFLLFCIALITIILILIHRYYPKLLPYVSVLLLIPVCFIATEPISMFDYAFIFTPALKMLQGFKISEIYFQYDLLLSALAFLWMKLHLELNSFQVIGQLSFFLFFTGSFLFAKRFLINKSLSVFLLIALVLWHYYANLNDPVAYFQVTPLRLDL